ncbi:DUF6492 family protein [Paenibacillus methanolicus]|uniref:Uncharacterized protein n=1 Tax=Paenibacillus methanolicus TaxID=582686 RepID=A0A5S5C1F8_9BACL|nr:DUF6492 family protein [Paenibacillus methanolicus]TYP73127.1 hypothetical protein BCM02_107111 [Paenibacillus methanolicus]
MPNQSEGAGASGIRIDVLIPAISKDLRTLPHVVEAVRRHSRHPVGDVVIVAPREEAILAACRANGWRFVDENTVLPITKKHIHYRSARWERSGWLFQQLLKLSGDKLVRSEHFLVIDADTVLIRPHRFHSGGRTTFYTRKWSQPEYFRTYRKLMGREASAPRSLVTHYMLFEKSKLRELKRFIEAIHGTSWYRAIIDSIDRTKQFGFSEYETYGNYVYTRYPDGVRLLPARNRALHARVDRMTARRYKKLAVRYRSVSFHEREGYVRSAAARVASSQPSQSRIKPTRGKTAKPATASRG